MANSESTPIEIDVLGVKSLLDAREDFLLIDCRQQDEYNLVHLQDATLIPLDQLAARVGELTSHVGKRVVVHCHHGGRSMRAAQWLRQQGFAHAQSMAGGIDAWAQQIEPGMGRY